MGSKAISAQGSKLYMGTGTGAAAVIAAITSAFRAEVTANHTLTKGDRVTFDSVGGMDELDGVTATVVDVTGTTKFCIDIDTRGFGAYTNGGNATPVTWTQIKELNDFKPSGAQVSKIDKTNLDSVAKEYSPGLPDNGDITASLKYVSDDAGLSAGLTAFQSGATKQFKLVTPNGANTFSFQGFFSKFPTIPEGAVDGLLLGNMTIQIDGAVTKS